MVVLIRGVSGSGKQDAVKRFMDSCPTAIRLHSDMAPSDCDPFLWIQEQVKALATGRHVLVVGQFKRYTQVLALRRVVPETTQFIVVNTSPRHADMQRWVGEVAL